MIVSVVSFITVTAVSAVSIFVARKHHKKKMKELRACVACHSLRVNRQHEKVKCPGGAVGEFWCRTRAHCQACHADYIEKDWYRHIFSRLRMWTHPAEFRAPAVKDIAAIDGIPKHLSRDFSK